MEKRVKDKHIIFGCIAMFLTGCTVIPADKLVHAKAANVYLSNKQPLSNCHYLGEVYSAQGNWFTGMFTSNIDIYLGSRNNLKDQAYENKANFIYLEATNINDRTLFAGGNRNVSIVGQAYNCENMGEYGTNLVNEKLCGYFSFCLDSE
ncbi:MAG: hypothetical protein ACJA0H_001172 [Francisellaceae bacterium]